MAIRGQYKMEVHCWSDATRCSQQVSLGAAEFFWHVFQQSFLTAARQPSTVMVLLTGHFRRWNATGKRWDASGKIAREYPACWRRLLLVPPPVAAPASLFCWPRNAPLSGRSFAAESAVGESILGGQLALKELALIELALSKLARQTGLGLGQSRQDAVTDWMA